MHLALSNELFTCIQNGAVPMAQPAANSFTEGPNVFSNIPTKITTFPSLERPAGVTRSEAVERLRRANEQLPAVIEGLSDERAGRHCVQLPFGMVSLYQFADFTGAHVVRHTTQLQRAVARL